MRLAWLAAPLLLGVSRLVPAHGAGLGFRLAAATACLLLPGALVARALGVEGLAGAFAWTMAALFGATALMFAVHTSLWFALGALVVVALVAAPFALRRPVRVSPWGLGVLALGAVAGISLWWVSGYDGDAFFHLAREQKLLAFDSLSLRSVDEFKDGGLHPGYAFPLWHAAIALIARLAGVGPAAVVLHAPTVLLPLSFVLTYEAGATLFRSRWAGVASAVTQFALLGLAPGHGGRVHVARAPGDRLARAAAAGAARARLRLRARAVRPAARLDRGCVDGDGPRPPEPLGARRRRARRVPDRARGARRAPRPRPHRRGARGDPGSRRARRRLAAPGRARDGLARPRASRGAAGISRTTGESSTSSACTATA